MLVRSQCLVFQCCPSLTQLAAHHRVPDSVYTHQWVTDITTHNASQTCLLGGAVR